MIHVLHSNSSAFRHCCKAIPLKETQRLSAWSTPLAGKASSGGGMGRRPIRDWLFFLVHPSESEQTFGAFSNPSRRTCSWQVIQLSRENILGQQDHPCTPCWQVMMVSIRPCAGKVMDHLPSLHYPFTALFSFAIAGQWHSHKEQLDAFPLDCPYSMT